MGGFSFAPRGLGGGAALTVSPSAIPPATTGAVAQLAVGLAGTVTFSKVSGAAAVTISGGGAVSLSSGLAAGATATFVARAANLAGDAIERSFTLTGIATDVGGGGSGGQLDFSDPNNSGLI